MAEPAAPNTPYERFVDSVQAANFIGISPRHLLSLARAGRFPAYPIGEGRKRVWRFRISELSAAMEKLAKRR